MSLQNYADKLMDEYHLHITTPERKAELEPMIEGVREYLQSMLNPHTERARLMSTMKAAQQVESTDDKIKVNCEMFYRFLELGGDVSEVPQELKDLQLGSKPHSPAMSVPKGLFDNVEGFKELNDEE